MISLLRFFGSSADDAYATSTQNTQIYCTYKYTELLFFEYYFNKRLWTTGFLYSFNKDTFIIFIVNCKPQIKWLVNNQWIIWIKNQLLQSINTPSDTTNQNKRFLLTKWINKIENMVSNFIVDDPWAQVALLKVIKSYFN